MNHNTYIAICFIAIFSCFGCSPKRAPNSACKLQTSDECESIPSTQIRQDDLSIDSLRQFSISGNKHSIVSSMDVSVNPYYDEGYDNGLEDGYYDGQENIRGDSYDNSSDYHGGKRKEYELGYEEGYEAGFDDGFADSDYDSEEEE